MMKHQKNRRARLFTLAALLVVLISNVFVGRSQTTQSDTVWSKNIGSEVLQVKFSLDGNNIYVGASGRKPIVLSTESGEIIREYEQSFTSVTAMDLSKDGKMLLVGGGSRNVEIINTETGLIQKLIIPEEINKLYDKMIIYSASISADQKECCIVTTGSNKDLEREGHVIIWNLSTYTYSKSINVGFAKRARYSPNDKLLAVCYEAANYKCPIELFETENYQKLSTLGYHSSITEDISFSPDGSLLASCGWDGFIKIWDVKERKLVREFNYGGKITAINFIYYDIVSFCAGEWPIYKCKILNLNNLEIKGDNLINFVNDADYSSLKNYIVMDDGDGVLLLNLKRYLTTIDIDVTKTVAQVIPNPNSSQLKILISILESNIYNIDIYDSNSKFINKIFDGFIEKGEKTLIWDASSYPSGTYFCIIKSKNYSDTLKIIVQR